MTSTKFYSNMQESLIAEFLGWSVTSGSGSRPCHPGDIYSEDWLGECKTHVKPGAKITISKKVWDKIQSEAQAVFKYPVLFIDDGYQSIDHTWCIYPYELVGANYMARHFSNVVTVNTSSLTFDHCKLSEEHKACFDSQINSCSTFVVSWHRQYIGICTLRTFEQLFGVSHA